MSALSTPGGGGTTTQSKPTSGKQKYQKLDINSLYCTNRNENSEPSSVKSQLSRKHGMQSLGKVPSTRRPPANLPSLKTETGQDPNANPTVPVVATTSVSSPPTCTPPTQPTASSSNAVAGTGPGGWVSLPPPTSPHFRTEFPSLDASAPPHRTDAPQPQLRPQTEGSWTSGGTTGGGARQESNSSPAAATAPAPAATSTQTPAYRAILPSFLVKGSSGGGLGLGGLNALRESRGPAAPARPPPQPRAPATPRAVEVLTARPILRDEQISSLDDISRDAGWAQHDDIDYDQKLDFSDGETSTNRKNNNRASIENDRVEQKSSRDAPEPGDEEQLWAERRQKQSNEVAQAVARARQRKEDEQRRQMRDPPSTSQPSKDYRDRDRNDNRDREPDSRERDRIDSRQDIRERQDVRERPDNRDKERDARDREKDRSDNRDRNDRDRFDNRDRDGRDARERERDRDKEPRDRGRDSRDRPEEKERQDIRDRGDNRERADRDRFERERERGDRDRDRSDRDRADRDRSDRDRERDRDFRDRDRDAHNRDQNREREQNRERDQNNPAFSKSFQANIPPRFLKQQQNRQQDDQHKGRERDGWAFAGKPAAPRRQEPQPAYNAPRHAAHNNGRRSYSRDFSDREDEFRRDKEGSGHQWRSEMQDYERSGRELDRSNSKDSYKSLENAIESSNRSAAEKLSEVFERKSIGIAEPFTASESSAPSQTPEKHFTPPDNVSQRESAEKDVGKASWAEVAQEEPIGVSKSSVDKISPPKEFEAKVKDVTPIFDSKRSSQTTQQPIVATCPPQNIPSSNTSYANAFQQNKFNNHLSSVQTPAGNNHQVAQNAHAPLQQVTQPSAPAQASGFDNIKTAPKPISQPQSNIADSFAASQMQKQQLQLSEQLAKLKYSREKDLSESGAVKPSIETQIVVKAVEITVEAVQINPEITKSTVEDKKQDARGASETSNNKIQAKEPIERKSSSGSGSEKKGRGFGGSGGFAVYNNNRGWGSRESRGRRSHRSSRSNNRASESDGSTDGAPPNPERKERRRGQRSPRGPKKPDRPEDANRPAQTDQGLLTVDGMENREPFAPRGQPSRRGRGGFQGTTRPPAPAKRVTGYGPPNTKSPFNQTNKAVRENEELKDASQMDDKGKGKPRPGSTTGRGRDRRPKGAGGPLSGEDENWETTSEHSEGGGRRRSLPGRVSQKGPGGRNQNNRNQNNARNNNQGGKKDNLGENKTADVTEAMTDLKISTAKKDDDVADDGFQEVRNKKNSKDTRAPPPKEETQQASKQQPRSHSNQGNGRNGSTSRNPGDKSNPRGLAPVASKNGQYDPRPRQANLAPRFVKQRQKQQLGMVSGYGPDTGAAPPPPAVNAWDKPIAQSLRGNVEEPTELVVNKSVQSSQRSTPAEVPMENKSIAASCAIPADKSEVLDGTTPPVETIIFENTNYKSAPSEEALQQKYQMNPNLAKPQVDDMPPEMESHPIAFNGADMRRPRSIQELIGDNGRPVTDGDASLGLQMSFDTTQKAEDSSDMKLDFAFDSDLGQLTEDKSAKSLGLPRSVHMSTSNTISPLAADLNLKIASVKKVWEMPAVAEGSEELQFAGFEEQNTETGAPPNVCKVKPTQQLQSPPPQHYNHVGYQGGYGGLSVPSPPAMIFNSSQQLLGSSQQLPQQGGLYGAFLDQSRGQFGGFPGAPYGAGSGAPYNYQPPPDMFQSLPNQYRMAATAGGGGFGQSGQLGNNPSTVLISSTSNSLMSATVKPSTQQIGAIGSKGGGVGGVGGVSAYQQQYLGYSAPVGEAPYSLPGLLPRPAPPANSYYSAYQPAAAPAPTYPLQFTQGAQSGAFGSQFLSSQLQVAAAVQQMQQQQQQQYRAPMQQQYAPQPRGLPQQQQQQQLKSPLHEHANGFAPLCDAPSPSPTPKHQHQHQLPKQKPPHSPPHHKYHAPPHHPHPHHQHQQHQQQHQHHQQQMVSGGGNGRCGGGGGGGGGGRGGMGAPRYPAPIQRPHTPAMPLYRAPPAHLAQPPRPMHAPAPPPQRHNLYYQHHQRNGGGGGGGGGERAPDGNEPAPAEDAPAAPAPASAPDAPQELDAE